MALPNITTKIINSDDYNERKILASDVNQIKQAIQTGVLDIKPSNIHMEGNVITADGGQNWIRRSSNKFQYYDAGTWKEITGATNTATFTAGENIAIRDVVYLKVSDGKIYKASNTNYDWIGVAKEAITNASTGEVYSNNSVIGGFTGLTRGAWYGLSDTAGSITKNKKEVGIAISSTQLIIIKNNTTELNNLYKLQGEMAINDVSATNSGIIAVSSQVLIDKFLDANGQNNTVDTGDTTGLFDTITPNYTCNYSISGASTESAEATHPSTSLRSYPMGYVCTVNNTKYLQTVVKHASSQSTIALLYLKTGIGTGTLMASATFSGNTATFTGASENLKLVADTTYYIVVRRGASSYNSSYNTSPSYPYNNTHINFTGAVYIGSSKEETNVAYDITAITVGDVAFTDSIVQSVATTIPSGKTKVFVTPLMYEALATGDSITADVSIDNGAHYTTGVPINTWTPITSANGTQLIVKANLLTGTGSTSPKISGWRVLME